MASPSEMKLLEVILTASCNLRCGYCYQNAKQARHMEWPTLRRGLDLLLASTQRDREVVFIGGEPLLQFPLIEQAVAYLRAHLAADRSISFATSTNGTLLTDATASFFAEHDFHVQISFDGVPESQAFRGAGTHAKIDAILTRLRRHHPTWFARRVKVAVTVHSGNVRYLADSIAYLVGKGFASIAIAPLTTYDADWTEAHVDDLRRQFDRIVALACEVHGRVGRVPIDVLDHGPLAPTAAPTRRSMCGAGSGQSIAIDVDGQVSGCVTFAESYQRPDNPFLRENFRTLRMGRVDDAALAERMAAYPAAARATRLFHRKEDKYSSYRRCGECEFLADCSVCPTSIGHIPGNTDPLRVPDPQCAFQMIALGARARVPARATLDDAIARAAALMARLRANAGEPRIGDSP